jgi:hypothetical protein
MIYTKRTYIHLYTFGAQKLRSSTKWHIRKSLLPTDLILQVHRDASLTQERLGPKSMSQLGSTSQFLGWKIQYGWKLKPCGKSLHTQGINQAVERGHLWWDVAICWARVTTPLEWHVILKNRWFRGLCNGVPRQICCEFPSIQPCKFWVSRFLCDFFDL